MRSLRSRLLLGTGIVLSVGFIASGVAIYLLVRSALYAEFDSRLVDTVVAMAALIDETEEGVEFDVVDIGSEEFDREDDPSFFQVWLDSDGELGRSETLEDADLTRFQGPLDQPVITSVELPDGRNGRQVGLRFHPLVDFEEGPSDKDEVLSQATVTVVVARGTEAITANLSRLSGLLTAVGLVATVSCLGLLGLAIRQSLRPLHRIAGQIARIDADRLNSRIADGQVPTEVSPIIERLNALLARLEEAFQRERTFSADVAHELRTPLAGLGFTIDVCLSRRRSEDEYREALECCLEICRQSEKMVAMLLDLARIESGRMEIRTETVSLLEVLKQCWSPLASRADAKQLDQHWDIDGSPTIEADRDKLAAVIQNLLENAVSHSDRGGSIHVTAELNNGYCQLCIRNTSSQIPAEDMKHVFQRFWRGDNSRGDTGDHFGLGLPLAKRLTELVGGTLQAESDDDIFRVILTLPTASATPAIAC